jgi:GGDEF domain-containing protein
MSKKFLWAVVIFFLLALPVFVLAFLNFSSLHGLMLLVYLFLAGGVAYTFGSLEEERGHWLAEGPRTPRLPVSDDVQIYHAQFLNLRLKEEYERAKRYQRPFSCLLIETDSLPAPALDEAIGRFLKKNMRSVDILIRQGEKRVFAILPETGLLGARITAERIRYSIEKNIFKIEEKETRTTVSVALVTFDPTLHSSPEALIDSLEKMLREAKKSGPNRVAVLADEKE